MGTLCRTLLSLPWVQDGETGLGGLARSLGKFSPQFLTRVKYLQAVPWSLLSFYS